MLVSDNFIMFSSLVLHGVVQFQNIGSQNVFKFKKKLMKIQINYRKKDRTGCDNKTLKPRVPSNSAV